jgi:hypothetical protein
MQRRRRKMETNMKSSRFTWLALASFCVAAVVAPLLAIPASQAGATSSSATMAETMGVAGVLSVTLQNASLNYGSALGVGTPTGDEPIGSVTYSNTLGDGSSWSVTVAATDLVISPAPSSCTVAAGCISATDQEIYTGGSTVTPSSAGVTPSNTTASYGSFTDTSPGTTFSPPNTLATGTSAASGSFQQNGIDADVNIPSGTKNGSYSGTLQFTITG